MIKYLKIALRKIVVTTAIIITALIGGVLIAILPEPVESREEILETEYEKCVVKDNKIVKCLSKVASNDKDTINYLGVNNEDTTSTDEVR